MFEQLCERFEQQNIPFRHEGTPNTTTKLLYHCRQCKRETSRSVFDASQEKYDEHLCMCGKCRKEAKSKLDMVKKHGTLEEIMDKVKGFVEEQGVKNLTSRKLKKAGLLNGIKHHKILVSKLKEQFNCEDIVNNEKEKNNKIKLDDAKDELTKLYKNKGLSVLNTDWLCKYSPDIYKIFRKNRYSIQNFADECGCGEKYKGMKADTVTKKANKSVRTEENFWKEAEEVHAEWGHFPSAEILRKNGYSKFCSDLYTKQFTTLQKLNDKFDVPGHYKRLSRNGLYMDSEAEVCVVNFLLARESNFIKGEKYPEEFRLKYGRGGIYDGHFTATTGEFKGKRINIEIWGGPRLRKKQEQYNEKRKHKEEFHKNDKQFLGIEYEDCYSEDKLTERFKPYIGIIEPHVFVDERDKTISCCKWNLTNDIEKGCKYIMENHPNHTIPSVCWMRREVGWKDREREEWEMTDSFNIKTFSYLIDRFGGIKQVRKYMNVKYKRGQIK